MEHVEAGDVLRDDVARFAYPPIVVREIPALRDQVHPLGYACVEWCGSYSLALRRVYKQSKFSGRALLHSWLMTFMSIACLFGPSHRSLDTRVC